MVNAQAPLKARLEIIEELTRLYRLDRMPEIARFTLFRNTYFQDADPALLDIFDRLLVRMFRHPERRATQMVELSDLQAALTDPDDRPAFNRLAFPHRIARRHASKCATVGDPEHSQVIVRSTIQRPARAPATPSANRPARRRWASCTACSCRRVSPRPSAKPTATSWPPTRPSRSSAGVVYRQLDDEAVFLDGIVVTQALAERGIAGAILADFCTRLTAAGHQDHQDPFLPAALLPETRLPGGRALGGPGPVPVSPVSESIPFIVWFNLFNYNGLLDRLILRLPSIESHHHPGGSP